MAKWFGANAPFVGGQEGVLTRQIDEKLIRNDMLQLLLTNPGERVMRPDFGTGIRQLIFENMAADNIEGLKQNIADAIAQQEPRVKVTDIQMDRQDDNNLLNIKIYGFFNLDIFRNQTSEAQQALLLVQYGLPLNANRQTNINGQVASS